MRRNILTIILIILLCVLGILKSPFAATYNYNKGKSFFDKGQYSQSIPYFERSLFSAPNRNSTRYFYALALSKVEPTYSIQEKLYKLANSDINDEAKKTAKAQVFTVKRKLLEGLEDNYIFNAISGKDIIRWNTFPLKVFIEEDNTIPPYYKENIEKALQQWEKSTSFVKFEKVDNSNKADIYIKFKDVTSNSCVNGECHYTVAYTEPMIGTGNILKKMLLTFYRTNPNKENYTPLEVYNSALHELGHTLGIMGHSDNSTDIMYSNNNRANDMYSMYRSDFQYLSMRDLKTLVLLYRLAPTITNIANYHNENSYYSQLVLGSDDEVLKKKLDESLRYIQDYPQMAAGYINIASVYSDMGDVNSAMEYLKKAELYANNTDEQYLIEYNKSVLNLNSGNYDVALTFAQKAQAIKNSPDVNELINEINEAKAAK